MINKLKTAQKRPVFKGLSKRARLFVLPLMIFVGAGAVILAIITIIVMPKVNPGAQRGVGANGFQAYVEQNGDLGIAKLVTKDEVAKALGDKAKSVDGAQVSKVMNIDGSRGQTATYSFVRTDGKKSSLYVDLMFFKNQPTLDAAHVTTATAKAGTISGRQAYYLHAQTLGSDREYRLMVVDGLKVYKFVIVQPRTSIAISEVSALASLKKLAQSARF